MTDKPNWSLYQNRPSFALGFHGTDEHVAAGVISGGVHLTRSENTYDWLGGGNYFWESDPQRALEWAQHGHAKGAINAPGLVGPSLIWGDMLRPYDKNSHGRSGKSV